MASQADIMTKIKEATDVYAEVRRCKDMEDACYKWFKTLFKRYGSEVTVNENDGDMKRKELVESWDGLMIDVYRRRDLCEWVNSNTAEVEVNGGVERVFEEMGIKTNAVERFRVEEQEEEVTEEFAEDGDGREELKIKEVLERTIKAIETQCPFEIVQS
ncbi:hypothetical protein TrLO_g11685 [Triparma laevis f. longispina]|uniref:Uncharacterized protein n=1 Tax=Triparma laevis f. longispina TaxID=1714387 RepID=A0A9W7F2W1_9STRA|nr:hypothetical protein TrLO_g11685 [Triparma laevis f. longispina]